MACMGEWRGAYRVLVVRTEKNRPLERYRHGWENNIKKDLQEIISGPWNGLIWPRTEISGELL